MVVFLFPMTAKRFQQVFGDFGESTYKVMLKLKGTSGLGPGSFSVFNSGAVELLWRLLSIKVQVGYYLY